MPGWSDDRALPTCGSVTLAFATNVTIIDESDGGEAATIAGVSEFPANMDGDDNCSAPQDSFVINEGDSAASGDTPCDAFPHGDWDIHDSVQF